MVNHYETLGINSSATPDEVRRAYRILARRYHPDLNPGKGTEDKFKLISESYAVLSDPERRRVFDIELQAFQAKATRASAAADASARARRAKAWQRAEEAAERARDQGRPDGAFWRSGAFRVMDEAQSSKQNQERPHRRKAPHLLFRPKELMSSLMKKVRGRFVESSDAKAGRSRPPSARVAIIEASVSFRDAVFGTKKTVEIQEPEGSRKVSVRIPPGVRNGSVIRLRSKDGNEELILVVRLAYHPFLSMLPKGLVVEVPVTVGEALLGASVTVPTLDDQLVVRIPPGTQSGAELRLKERGVKQKDGSRGDLFVRIMIYIPDSPEAPGLKEKASEFDRYYSGSVRSRLPRSLLDEQ